MPGQAVAAVLIELRRDEMQLQVGTLIESER